MRYLELSKNGFIEKLAERIAMLLNVQLKQIIKRRTSRALCFPKANACRLSRSNRLDGIKRYKSHSQSSEA
jgi:hypothetical protein